MCKRGKSIQGQQSLQKKLCVLPAKLGYVFIFVLLNACTPQIPIPTLTISPTGTPIPSGTLTSIPSPVPLTHALSPTAPQPTITPSPFVCSPLEGIAIPELPNLIHNPYAPPRLGSDDPHQGVDFADIDPVYEIALEGRPVQAVLSGSISAVIQDRFPYG